MAEQATFSRITVRPDQMGGVPCVRGLRIPVATVVGLLAQGMTHQQVLREYPDLEQEDLLAALRFAAAAVDERQVQLLASELGVSMEGSGLAERLRRALQAATRRRSFRFRSSWASRDEIMSPPTSESLARSMRGISR